MRLTNTVPQARAPAPVAAMAIDSDEAGEIAPVARGRSRRALAAIPFALALLVYANALHSGFTWDDAVIIEHNDVVTQGVDVLRIFASPLAPGDLYRPVTVLTFALNYRLGPGNTAAFHAVNVLLHATATVLVFLIAADLFVSPSVALVSALLFAAHPIHTEAVTSLVGRAELLAAVCGMAAMVMMAQADRVRTPRARFALQMLSVMSFCLALLSKESALVFAPLVFWFRSACRRERLRQCITRELRGLDWVPYAVCVVLYCMLRARVTGGLTVTTATALDNPLAFVPANVRVPSALGVLWDYFGLINFPFILSADYSFAQVPILSTWMSTRSVAGIALVGAVVIVVVRDRDPARTFVTALPLIALSLTSNLLLPIGTIKAERLLYFPSVGWALLVADGSGRLMRIPRYRRASAAALLGILAAFAVRTWARNADWKSNATLYRSMVRTAPDSAKAHFNLGVIYQDEGDDDAAMAQFRRALKIYEWAGNANAALGIGLIYDRRHQMDLAIEWFRKALEIEPGLSDAHTHLCGALFVTGRPAEAALACRRGLRYDPTDANLLKGLGESLITLGERSKGAAVLRRSLLLNPGDEMLRTRLHDLSADG